MAECPPIKRTPRVQSQVVAYTFFICYKCINKYLVKRNYACTSKIYFYRLISLNKINKKWLNMVAKTQISHAFIRVNVVKNVNVHKLALVFGFNIKPIHSAVDLGNQSAAACEFFCIVCERLTIPVVRAWASPPAAQVVTCFAGRLSSLLKEQWL